MRSWLKISLLIFAFSTVFISVTGVVLIYILSRDLPPLEMIEIYKPPAITRILDDEENVIYEFYEQKRIPVKLEKISPHIKDAFITLEDKRFFSHPGFDILRILKALYVDIKARAFVEGASTITQQLARNMFLTPEKSLMRKVKELLLSLRIEKAFPKETILQKYLNQIYFGHGIYGVEAASQFYLDKGADEVTLAEAALLAAIPRAPSLYSPIENFERAKSRQKKILKLLLKNKRITDEEYRNAIQETLNIHSEKKANIIGAYFVEEIRKKIINSFGDEFLYREGGNIYTTLDSRLQKICEKIVDSLLPLLNKKTKRNGKNDTVPLQVALVAIQNKTGEIKALIGGKDFSESQFNRATQAKRQVGSAFKPFIYLAAMDNGFRPSDPILDLPIVIEDDGSGNPWYPTNYDEKFLGKITLRKALALSRNLATVRLLQQIGVPTAIQYARDMGIESRMPRVLSIALGSSSLSLLEMTHAYSTIANYGKRVELIWMRKIEDAFGNILIENNPSGAQVTDSLSTYILINMMESVFNRGTAVNARLKFNFTAPAGGKTGTTDNYTDAWFIGFIPELTLGVWVGFDSLRTIAPGATGSHFALPIWTEIIKRVESDRKGFPAPRGIVTDTVCVETGLLAGPYCPETKVEIFKKEESPTDTCNVHIFPKKIPDIKPFKENIEF